MLNKCKMCSCRLLLLWCLPNNHSHLQVPWSSRVVLWIKSPHSRPFCFPWNSTTLIGSVVPKIFRPFGMWEWLFSLCFGFFPWRSTFEGIHLLCDFTISANDPLHFSDPFKLTGLVLGVEPLTRLKSWVHLGLNFHTKKIQNCQMGLIFNTKTRTISGCKNRIAPFAFLVLA